MLDLIGCIGAGAVTALGGTFAVRFSGHEHLTQARGTQGRPVIYAFWHEGLLIAAYAFRHRRIRVLVSQHRDGEYISRTIERMGYTTVRGSTTRGGARALFRMAAAGTAGDDLGITVDGPRGPRLRAQAGALYVAMRSGLPILPFAVACSRKRVLSSWDRFIVPLPFARVAVVFGAPVRVAAECGDDGLETRRCELERRLLEARETAEHLVSTPG